MPSSEPDSCSSPGSQRTASPAWIASRSPLAPLTQPEPLDDDEELRDDGRVTRDDAAGRDLDHHGVSFRGQASYPRADASRRGHLTFAAKLDPPHTRSITAAIAWPKPMHMVATP